MSKAVFIDRDGTLNEEVHYLSDPDKFSLIKGSLEGLKILTKAGYRIILVTNQAGIAKGKLTLLQLEAIHSRMQRILSRNGIALSPEEIFFCPHRGEDNCGCRKPNVKNFKEAQKRFNLDPAKSYVIGDKTSDLEAGRRGGYATILVKTGYGGTDAKYDVLPDFIAKDLLEAAKFIIERGA
ncbi:MAG: HAD family hydrolase [Candidatus Micrarchaeota archaeon]